MRGFKIVALAVFVTVLSLSLGDETVRHAAVVYRHGDRTPVDTYPTDPYRDQSLWPEKFGQLTNIGKSQHFAFGKYLRTRYSQIVSEKFDPMEIYIKSTDVDRTLMSAQANLAGMFPPTGSSIWNSELLWQPIPVHTKPEKDDEVLAMKKDCMAYKKEKIRYTQTPAYKKKLKSYQGVMDYLTTHTGRKIKDYTDIMDIYSTLQIEESYNFTLPNWTHAVYPHKMQEPACYSFQTPTGTPLMARLLVGPLLKDIVSKMVDFVTKKSSLKLSVYSAHDFTIGNILSGLGLYDGNCPVYTSTVFFDLLQDNSNNTYYIRISYKNSTEIIEPRVLYIPHCGEKCPIERFIRLYDNLLSVDWEYDCGKKVKKDLFYILCRWLACHYSWGWACVP
ncbi:prostatic acid phosphatase-like isoform X2 [Epargyreus clarus]|uniref:prostatic acid phosphatase-like isoform X2 n=1 Tax=Epargyreus clarus TaxID=520877 RepID=UPI003C2BD827